jgi:hypothetical protein
MLLRYNHFRGYKTAKPGTPRATQPISVQSSALSGDREWNRSRVTAGERGASADKLSLIENGRFYLFLAAGLLSAAVVFFATFFEGGFSSLISMLKIASSSSAAIVGTPRLDFSGAAGSACSINSV